MGSLASRIFGREILTLQEFADDVLTRVIWEHPEAMASLTRPDCITVAFPRSMNTPAELLLDSAYRAYQKDPNARESIIKRLLQWVDSQQ